MLRHSPDGIRSTSVLFVFASREKIARIGSYGAPVSLGRSNVSTSNPSTDDPINFPVTSSWRHGSHDRSVTGSYLSTLSEAIVIPVYVTFWSADGSRAWGLFSSLR